MAIHTNTTKPDTLYIAGDLLISTNIVTNADLSIVHAGLLEEPCNGTTMLIAIPTKRDLKFGIHCGEHLLPRTKQLRYRPKLPKPRTV